ncbi:hypothetical protein ACFPRL_22825 [Pseudoclavibacter helvolus]
MVNLLRGASAPRVCAGLQEAQLLSAIQHSGSSRCRARGRGEITPDGPSCAGSSWV